MTRETLEKFHQNAVKWSLWIACFAGAVEALLIARLVARLLAGRPDHPALVLLYALTGPLTAPLAGLDFGQPPFGAAFELSTLVMATLVPVLAYLAWVLLRRGATAQAGQPS